MQRYNVYFKPPNFGVFFCVFFRVYLVHQFWVQMLTFYPRCLSGCKGTAFILNCLILACFFVKFFSSLFSASVLGADANFLSSLPKRVQRYYFYFELPNFGVFFCKVFWGVKNPDSIRDVVRVCCP